MGIDVKKRIKKEKVRNFLAKDFNGFRAELLQYARTYFPDKIQDFTEASLGGLFLDMAAMVGDTMSFYLDHQFNELNPLTAVENSNILRHLRAAGVKLSGAAPASVKVRFYVEVQAEKASSGNYQPIHNTLPVVLAGTQLESAEGIVFNLVEDIDFSEKDDQGIYKARATVSEKNTDGTPATYIMSREGLCVSGKETVESFSIGTAHVPFRQLVLRDINVSDIISVTDTQGNKYYQVETLSQDTVFKGVLNIDDDGNLVPMNLEVSPCPYRFVANFDPRTKLTTLQFGSGNAETFDDDIIPDPSKLSLDLYGKTTFSRFAIDPQSLLETQSLGIAPRNTKLRVSYRSGGGLSHNVAAESIRFVKVLHMEFRRNPTATQADFVRSSIDVKNKFPARGGDKAPTLDELRRRAPAARQMQSRIVTKQDMLTRIYTLPSKFGRVFRAGIRANPANPLATQIFVATRDKDGYLDIAPDQLKLNLSTYLNEFRLISDAMDILDAQVINFSVKFGILTAPDVNKTAVVDTVIKKLAEVLSIDNFQIDQPIVLDDLVNIIINTQGVLSLMNLDVQPVVGTVQGRSYGSATFNFKNATKNRMIVGPPGSIFEMKYLEHDIIGTAS
ncbi:hypothetical protein CMK19_01190 [Candidatus Poribacteria bacterium]|nr:hypothetical protein [Candidatus Poribacteria bacterium]